MCLLTFTSADATPDYDALLVGALSNPDGFGFAVHLGDTIIVDKDMDAGDLLHRYEEVVKANPGCMSMFHSRLTTHGGTNLTNCHPFYTTVGGEDLVIGHNGVLDIDMPKNETRSDTRYWAEVMLPQRGSIRFLDRPNKVRKLEKWLGWNKLVIFTTSRAVRHGAYIMNEDAGHWNDGTWYSNDSYRGLSRFGSGFRSVVATVLSPEGSAEVSGQRGVSPHPNIQGLYTCDWCMAIMDMEDVAIFGYCHYCGTCFDCGADAPQCLCYTPASKSMDLTTVSGAGRYSFDGDFDF